MMPHAPPPPPLDTSAAAAEVQRNAWRAMTGAERLGIALELSTAVHKLALAGLRARYPDDSDEALVRRLHAAR